MNIASWSHLEASWKPLEAVLMTIMGVSWASRSVLGRIWEVCAPQQGGGARTMSLYESSALQKWALGFQKWALSWVTGEIKGFHLGILVVSWAFLEVPWVHLVPSCRLPRAFMGGLASFAGGWGTVRGVLNAS